jgi:hypothetical protein
MTDKLEMPFEQFAEAVAKENARLNEHNEKLKEQTKLYFHAFNKAAVRIKKLEAALKFYASTKNYEQIWHEKRQMWVSDIASDQGNIAREALEGKND